MAPGTAATAGGRAAPSSRRRTLRQRVNVDFGYRVFFKMVSEAQRTGLGRQLETGGVDAGIRAEDDAQLVSMAK